MTSIEYIEKALTEATLNKVLNACHNADEKAWAAMNDPETNGTWWNDKRMMLPTELGTELGDTLLSLNLNISNLSATNKAQRLFRGDVLGPMIDQEHVPQLKYGSVLFLNNSSGSISFPEIGLMLEANTNNLIIYPANMTYVISGPAVDEPMLFSTVFMD
jgi:hypothetical protein